MITAERPTTARPQIVIPDRMPALTYSQALVADRELPINEIALGKTVGTTISQPSESHPSRAPDHIALATY